jgi:hypothetical protein
MSGKWHGKTFAACLERCNEVGRSPTIWTSTERPGITALWFDSPERDEISTRYFCEIVNGEFSLLIGLEDQ